MKRRLRSTSINKSEGKLESPLTASQRSATDTVQILKKGGDRRLDIVVEHNNPINHEDGNPLKKSVENGGTTTTVKFKTDSADTKTSTSSEVNDNILADLMQDAYKKTIKHDAQFHQYTTDETIAIRSKLLDWYDSNQRILPWRVPSAPFLATRTESDQKIVSEDSFHRFVNVDLPYAVHVSEIMLQQTQVATVILYYKRWMEKWPTIADLAKADIESVNSVWQGLGYYSRAKRLHEGAQLIMKEYNGQLPETAAALCKIPGIGRYTSAAVASIARGQPVGVVDGNVIRVLARLRSLGCNFRNGKTVEIFWTLADALVDPERPGDYNQALMELGATVCVPKTPKCGECPLATHCRAYAETKVLARDQKSQLRSRDTSKRAKKPKIEIGYAPEIKTEEPFSEMAKQRIDTKMYPACTMCGDNREGNGLGMVLQPSVCQYPFQKPKKAARLGTVAVSVVRCSGSTIKYLMVKRPDSGLLAGMWEFPSVELPADAKSTTALRRKLINTHCKEDLQTDIVGYKTRQEMGEVLHKFSHIHNTYHVELICFAEAIYLQNNGNDTSRTFQWVPLEDMEKLALSTAMRKVLKLAEGTTKQKSGQNQKSGGKDEKSSLKQPKLTAMFVRKAKG